MTNYINRQMEKRNTDVTEKEQINIERWFEVKKLEKYHTGGRIHLSSVQIPSFFSAVESFYIYVNLFWKNSY